MQLQEINYLLGQKISSSPLPKDSESKRGPALRRSCTGNLLRVGAATIKRLSGFHTRPLGGECNCEMRTGIRTLCVQDDYSPPFNISHTAASITANVKLSGQITV